VALAGAGVNELAQRLLHLERAQTAFIGPSSMTRQGAEQADELVADELVDRPFVLEQDVDMTSKYSFSMATVSRASDPRSLGEAADVRVTAW